MRTRCTTSSSPDDRGSIDGNRKFQSKQPRYEPPRPGRWPGENPTSGSRGDPNRASSMWGEQTIEARFRRVRLFRSRDRSSRKRSGVDRKLQFCYTLCLVRIFGKNCGWLAKISVWRNLSPVRALDYTAELPFFRPAEGLARKKRGFITSSGRVG